MQPLEKELYPASCAKVSAGTENPVFPNMSDRRAMCGGSGRCRPLLEPEQTGTESGAPGRNL